MTLPSIDVDAIPLLDTMVGLFGSLTTPTAQTGPSVFEVSVTVIVILYD